MDFILMDVSLEHNQVITVVFLCLAVFRVYLEVIGFDWNQLPLSKLMAKRNPEGMLKFHRMGLVFSIGYIVFTAPGFLLS
jgi:predicted transcriptional regulator